MNSIAIVNRFDVFFFFQAEDGIRDLTVTGVQTCALPICTELKETIVVKSRAAQTNFSFTTSGTELTQKSDGSISLGGAFAGYTIPAPTLKIGRASCRERV